MRRPTCFAPAAAKSARSAAVSRINVTSFAWHPKGPPAVPPHLLRLRLDGRKVGPQRRRLRLARALAAAPLRLERRHARLLALLRGGRRRRVGRGCSV